MLSDKKILVGITGSIAAYKSAILVREFVKLGADVKVIMTQAATEFISPLTLSTLSKNPVSIEFVKDEERGIWENHVDLGLWADAFVFAPLSANTLSKMVSGNSDNFLIATYLSAKCPVWVAPAMDLDMFKHFSTQENLSKLSEKGVHIVEPTAGELASGLEGKGRMEEPENIARVVHEYFMDDSELKGKKIVITGGPTYEAIDPVRFIGNHSSGLTGVLLADACANRGAEVVLVTGPTKYKVQNPTIKTLSIQTAEQMMDAVKGEWPSSQVGIFSAAVSDYRPAKAASEKIKKSDQDIELKLVKNPDILAWAGETRTSDQYLVGFALETENEEENAKGKFERKKLDLLVLNSLKDERAGFRHSTNKVTFIQKNNKLTNFELKEKSEMVEDILNAIEEDIK